MRKTGKKEAATKPAKKSKDNGDVAGKLSGRKRGREQLSPEGFDDSPNGETGLTENSDEEGEEARRAEEAKRAKAEKKKQKLKALKVKRYCRALVIGDRFKPRLLPGGPITLIPPSASTNLSTRERANEVGRGFLSLARWKSLRFIRAEAPPGA